MAVEVRIPTVLRKFVNGEKSLEAEADTVLKVLEAIEARHPGFKEQVVAPDGQLHRFINLYLNDEDVRYLQSVDTPVKSGDVVAILPAVAGGGGSGGRQRPEGAAAPRGDNGSR